jgi:hypothetical protein
MAVQTAEKTLLRKIGDLATWTRVVVRCPQQSVLGEIHSGMFMLKFVECECWHRSAVEREKRRTKERDRDRER